jgi:hypothetical protein
MVKGYIFIFILISKSLLASTSQEQLVCAENYVTPCVNISPTDPQVKALIIYISFPDLDPDFQQIPTWSTSVELVIEDYFTTESSGLHSVDVETVYRPAPNQALCYITDYNSEYYANLIFPLDRDGLGVLTDEIFWKVYNDNSLAFNDIDVVYMNYNCYGGDLFWHGNSAWATLGNYSFPYYNGCGTTSTIWNDKEIMEWSTAHEYGHLLGANHHNVGIYCQMDGSSWDSSKGVRPYCNFLKCYFGWIDNSKFETITSNSYNIMMEPSNLIGKIYKVVFETQAFFIENRQGLLYDDVYSGTGLLIWHGSTSNSSHGGKDLETADGRWNWDRTDCQEYTNKYTYPFVHTTENPDYGQDELDLRYVNVCENGQYEENKSHPDLKGDVDDFYQIGGNILFAPWTNPSSNSINGDFTDIMVKVKSQNGNTIVADVLIDAPPSTPAQFRVSGRNGSHPILSWRSNPEPDISGYNIYRKLDGENTYSLIHTSNADETSFTDISITINNFSPAQAYYHITAIDDSQNESDPTIDRWVHYNAWKTIQSLSYADDYFPLHLGDRWQYRLTTIDTIIYKTFEILGDTIMPNGKQYYLSNFAFLTYIRIDTTDNIVYAIDELYSDTCQSNELDFFQLFLVDSGTGTSSNCHDVMIQYENGRMYSALLGDTTDYIEYEWSDYLDHRYRLSKHLGMTYFFHAEGTGGYGELVAAEINGITYGDFIAIDNRDGMPEKFILHQAYPNPFNPIVTIKFEIGVEIQRAVTLKIFDINGRVIATLIDGKIESGIYEIQWNAANQPSGIYFIRLESSSTIQTRKITLLK